MTTQINLNNIVKDVVEHEIVEGNLSAVIPQNLTEKLNQLFDLYRSLITNSEDAIIKKDFFDNTIDDLYQDLSNTILSDVNYSDINSLFMTEDEEWEFINYITKYFKEHPEELSVNIAPRGISSRQYEDLMSYENGFTDGSKIELKYTPDEFCKKCSEIQDEIDADDDFPEKDEECSHLSVIADICENYKTIQDKIQFAFNQVFSNDQFLAYHIGLIAGFCNKLDITVNNPFNKKDLLILQSLVFDTDDDSRSVGNYKLERHPIGTIGYDVIINNIDTSDLYCPVPGAEFIISANMNYPYLYTVEAENNNYGWNKLIDKYSKTFSFGQETDEGDGGAIDITLKVLEYLKDGVIGYFTFWWIIIKYGYRYFFGSSNNNDGKSLYLYTIKDEQIGKKIVDFQLLDKLLQFYSSFGKALLRKIYDMADALNKLCQTHYKFHNMGDNCSKDTEWYGKESSAPLSANIYNCHDKNISILSGMTEEDLPAGFEIDNGLTKYYAIHQTEFYCDRTEEEGCLADSAHRDSNGNWITHILVETGFGYNEIKLCPSHDDNCYSAPEGGTYDKDLGGYVFINAEPAPASILEDCGHGEPTYYPVDINVHE